MNILNNMTFGIEFEAISKVSRWELANHYDNLIPNYDFEGEEYNHQTRDYWKVVYDDSLDTWEEFTHTTELVSPILKGESGFRDLKNITSFIERDSMTKVNKSCGTHIHLGINQYWEERRLTVEQKIRAMKNLFMIYTKYQDEIDSILSPSRRSNKWAHNLIYTTTQVRTDRIDSDSERKKVLRNFSRKLNKKHSIQAIHEMTGTRYQVINLQNWVSRGTVEFRQHQGTQNFEKIKHWIIFLMKLIERATDKAIQDKKITSGIRTNGRAKFNQIFKRKMKRETYQFFLERRLDFEVNMGPADYERLYDNNDEVTENE